MRRRRSTTDLRPTCATPDEQAEFDREVADHDRVERRLLWKEVAALTLVAAFVVVRQLWLQ